MNFDCEVVTPKPIGGHVKPLLAVCMANSKVVVSSPIGGMCNWAVVACVMPSWWHYKRQAHWRRCQARLVASVTSPLVAVSSPFGGLCMTSPLVAVSSPFGGVCMTSPLVAVSGPFGGVRMTSPLVAVSSPFGGCGYNKPVGGCAKACVMAVYLAGLI